MSLLDRIQPVNEIDYYVKFLLYGPPGAGKTRLVGEGMPNPVWLDVERSAETLRSVPHLATTPVFKPKNFEEMFELAKLVVQRKLYDTIVIDTIGRAQANQVHDYLDKETKKSDGSRSRSQYLALWGDFRVSTNMLDEFFVFLQDAPIHVVLIAHHEEVYNFETKALIRIKPDITPTLAQALTGLINVVGYLECTRSLSGTAERTLTVNEINKIVAKNRLNIQEPRIRNPNLKEIFFK